MGQAVRLEGFSGLVPRTSPRLLQPMQATTARNTKLLNGEARGFRVPRQLADFTALSYTTRRAYRIPYSYGDLYLTFSTRNVDIIRSPIVNDSFDRYYWAGDGRPKYNPLDRIANELDGLYLGIPTPTIAPTVTPANAGSDLTRAYVYTLVSAYGEEGPPSPPTTVSGNAGTWNLSGMQTTVDNPSFRNITTKKIYRTVPGNSSSLFFYVGEVPLGTATYADTVPDATVASNNTLESTTWLEPPVGMEGFVVMPGGYLVGWAGRRLLFSEPYRPHAWPAEYELSTEFEIVGLVVWGTTLIVGTKSNPYFGQGNTPAAFTLQKMDAVEPCLSRRGMVATVAGAYYPSINGLILANAGGVRVITQDLLTKEEWARYNPSNIYAAQLGLQYVAFSSDSFGFIFNPTEPNARLVEIDRLSNVEGIETDRYTGNVSLIYQDRLWEWDPETSERMFWRWKSKEFHVNKPLNFGAVKIKFDDTDNDVSIDVQGYYGPYNTARFAAGTLNTIGGHAIDGVENTGLVPDWTEPENKMEIGGDPLYPINDMLSEQSAVRFIAYADGEKVFDRVINRETIFRMPAGFKRDVWQFEMVSNTNVYSVTIAETGKDLANA